MNDSIELVLPFKAEYVSTARLVASALANRVRFDIETIEDIKVAISEVCSKIVNLGSKITDTYKIIFNISEKELKVTFACEDTSLKCIFDIENDQLAIDIINALMDSVELCTHNNYILSMSKVLEENI
ncbi:ATP-binding protein [Acetivibrio cellulolyticus]|uniref:ATP-binding protein n=1 Tax=Acetivibrio cellulolyticus TaxID=35830 RepID=UPI0001E2BE5E|nr:ATP-binding protein [Acetivibrio cellulolyticus]